MLEHDKETDHVVDGERILQSAEGQRLANTATSDLA